MSNLNFLENLKNAVDSGDFNSEAAKKINEINELADKKSTTMNPNDLEKKIDERIKDVGTKTVTEEEAVMINSEYEKKMEEIKISDKITLTIKNIIEMDDLISESIDDLMFHIKEIEVLYKKDFDSNEKNVNFVELENKIKETKLKYSTFTNT